MKYLIIKLKTFSTKCITIHLKLLKIKVSAWYIQNNNL